MIIITVTFEIDPADDARVISALTTMVATSASDPGCITYGFCVDPSCPQRFRAYEEWETADAIAAHMATPHAAAFSAALATLRRSFPGSDDRGHETRPT